MEINSRPLIQQFGSSRLEFQNHNISRDLSRYQPLATNERVNYWMEKDNMESVHNMSLSDKV